MIITAQLEEHRIALENQQKAEQERYVATMNALSGALADVNYFLELSKKDDAGTGVANSEIVEVSAN